MALVLQSPTGALSSRFEPIERADDRDFVCLKAIFSPCKFQGRPYCCMPHSNVSCCVLRGCRNANHFSPTPYQSAAAPRRAATKEGSDSQRKQNKQSQSKVWFSKGEPKALAAVNSLTLSLLARSAQRHSGITQRLITPDFKFCVNCFCLFSFPFN